MKINFLKSVSTIVICFFAFSMMAQNIIINENGRIADMMRTYKNINQNQGHMQAWRIQIITTDDRRKMETARAQFNGLYPAIRTEWKHVSPWYHLKAGAYKTKLELQGFLIQVKQNFPGAIPIMDKVKKEELLSP
jgi:hypothetical protein